MFLHSFLVDFQFICPSNSGRFAPVSAGAADRLNRIGAGHDRICLDFLGVRDPEYGEAAYEEVFRDLYSRAAGFLDRMERNRADM